MTERPAGLKPLCVIAVILGSMGLGAVLLNVMTQVAQSKIPVMPPDPRHEDLNAQYRERFRKVNEQLGPLTWAYLPFAALSSGLLLAGGIQGLKARGRRVLGTAFAAGLAIDLASAVLTVVTQLKIASVFTWYVQELTARPNPPPGLGIMSGTFIAGVGFAVVWYLAKAGYYVWGLITLRKPAVRSWFEPTSGSSSPATERAPSS